MWILVEPEKAVGYIRRGGGSLTRPTSRPTFFFSRSQRPLPLRHFAMDVDWCLSCERKLVRPFGFFFSFSPHNIHRMTSHLHQAHTALHSVSLTPSPLPLPPSPRVLSLDQSLAHTASDNGHALSPLTSPQAHPPSPLRISLSPPPPHSRQSVPLLLVHVTSRPQSLSNAPPHVLPSPPSACPPPHKSDHPTPHELSPTRIRNQTRRRA